MPQAATAKPQDLSNEFVVGGRYAFSNLVERNDTRDRDERRLDQRAIRRMRLDGEVEADVSMLSDSVFADGIEVTPAIVDEEDAEYAEAQEISDFIAKAVSDPQRPLVLVCKEMFKAAFYGGVKVGEIVLRYQDDSRIDGKLVLDRINPKPASATAFVTDKFLNVLGLIGARRPGTLVANTTVALSSDEIIPREKFLVFAFELEDNDPRGLSQVRAAFEDYCDKQLTRDQWKEWRKTSAIPAKFGTTADKAPDIPIRNSDGSFKYDENGVQLKQTAERSLMAAMEGWVNNSSIAVPFGYDVKQLEVNGTGVQFERALRYNDLKIRKVILGDSLVTGEADKDARAAREAAKDVADVRKQSLRTVIADAIKRDVFRLLTVINFGADKSHLTPDCFLGDTESTDWARDLTAATSAGYSFASEHLATLDTQFGLEPRSENQDTVNTPNQPNQPDNQQRPPQQDQQGANQ